ncbi:peptidoglycan/xylan/chitin deacetylase (PgdA/CDA1 family) [Streptomyces sp. Amel2xB2]|uniref:polysaccharide deacetylase family protein n=1 Tax=Streptomyces sp. Amel2xB2 TaxID=1305829 RepID=UPI000DBAB6B6|nr:polysaccharide deacetylase family protein [Streptomyces sp. Amel2xB2]RAJ65653.1 peptidoglycan/xylan/chitin deacetylase (PgdA/CDA1 family) [Streptomyces sp. Amel2xB2]
MVSTESRTNTGSTGTRRIFLGGLLIAGACVANRAHAAGGGAGSGSGSGVSGAHAAADAKGAGAARRSLRSARTASRPQAYRLRPEAGQLAAQARGSTSVTYTLDSGDSGGREIALTFDDGPDPLWTPKVLEVLRRWRVQATFCVIGREAAAHAHLLNAIADGGHAIANHSWSHPLLTRMRPAQVHEQLARTCDVVDEAVGSPPVLARAPFGEWNDRTLEISASLGMSPLGWSVDTSDWEEPGTRKITATVLRHTSPGAVLLSHDGGGNRSQTVAALRDYLPRLLDSGYIPVLPSGAAAFRNRTGEGWGG